MDIKKRNLEGVFEITLNPIVDSRGFFMRTYDMKILEELGIHKNWLQENHSKSTTKGVIRGLHFQFPPYSETKLVRCIKGCIFDVFVDLRKNSKTFGKWDCIELSEENKKMVLIPRGFAHGFCTLTDNCEVLYKVDNFYSKENEGGLIWNDPDLNINWPIQEPILSDKDSKNITLAEFIKRHKGLRLEGYENSLTGF